MATNRARTSRGEDTRTAAEDSGLEAVDFTRIQLPGFNESTRTSQAATWFRDSLIVGTGRSPLGFLGRYNARQAPAEPSSRRSAVGAREDEGAELWRIVPGDAEPRRVYCSPVGVGRDGQVRARDRSIRAMLACGSTGGNPATLYVAAGSLERQVLFLSTTDGESYTEAEEHGFGFGDVDVPSVRNIVELNGRFYSSPTGKNNDRGIWDDNITDYPYVMETEDPIRGHWRPVSLPGFGDPENLSVNEMAVLNGCLYAATINVRRGFQLWRTRPEGAPPYRWVRILEAGGWRGPASSIPSALYVFQNALYIGATLQRQGRGGRDRFGPYPAELLRVFPDDTWELVAGQPRFTPHGQKLPVSGMQGGFDDRYTHVFWRMAEYRGWLYLGTAGWKWAPTYLRDRPDLSSAQLACLQAETAEHRGNDYALWKTRDGVHWLPVTRCGLPGSNPNNYGIRELVSSPAGLFVIPTSRLGALQGGGLEIWRSNR